MSQFVRVTPTWRAAAGEAARSDDTPLFVNLLHVLRIEPDEDGSMVLLMSDGEQIGTPYSEGQVLQMLVIGSIGRNRYE